MASIHRNWWAYQGQSVITNKDETHTEMCGSSLTRRRMMRCCWCRGGNNILNLTALIYQMGKTKKGNAHFFLQKKTHRPTFEKRGENKKSDTVCDVARNIASRLAYHLSTISSRSRSLRMLCFHFTYLFASCPAWHQILIIWILYAWEFMK